MIAAASTAGIASAMIGTPSTDTPPPKPPFAKPTMITAGTATA